MATVINLRPLTVDLELYSGDDKTFQLRLWTDKEHTTPVNVTGLTFSAQVRRDRKSSDMNGMWPLSVVVTPGTPPYVDILFDKTMTAQAPASCVWDLQCTNQSGERTTLITGTIDILKDVTR